MKPLSSAPFLWSVFFRLNQWKKRKTPNTKKFENCFKLKTADEAEETRIISVFIHFEISEKSKQKQILQSYILTFFIDKFLMEKGVEWRFKRYLRLRVGRSVITVVFIRCSAKLEWLLTSWTWSFWVLVKVDNNVS